MKSVNQKKQAIGREFCEQQMTTCENCKFNTHPYLKLSELKFLHPKSKYLKGRILHVKNHISSFLFAFFLLLLLLSFCCSASTFGGGWKKGRGVWIRLCQVVIDSWPHFVLWDFTKKESQKTVSKLGQCN